MNFENHMHNTKTHLAMAQSKIEARDYDTALTALGEAYSKVRMMIELVWVCKVEAARAERPAGDDSGGPES